ncbi:hypothetical protein KL86DPRO_20268 [uncultured delta proteobacterium]|uniref:Uncharacterized protein n=1 Tax=uncultured delta proteobacterium TaxID=34034 RepID=A0A212JXM4_9DELT|nr:hypothetical protein KL86DPRO_20268 [uncultured delta proteobacterium]
MSRTPNKVRAAANKVLYPKQLHTPACAYTGSQTIPTNTPFYPLLPEPVLHKITLSWRTGKNLHAEIVKLFGPRRGNSFLNGLFLKKVEDKPWWSIFFNADDKILAGLSALRDKISPWFESDVQLKQVEVAWNLPCTSYRAAKTLMLNLADNTLLQGVYARLWPEPPEGGKIQENKDGTKNGEVTAYFHQLRPKKGEYVLVKRPDWDAKMYLKEINGIWHLHIEVTLEKPFLKDNGIPMGIPTSVSPDWLKGLPLERFLKFASFDMPAVIDELRGLLSARRFHKRKKKYTSRELHKMTMGLRKLSAAMDYPACEQKRDACKVADIFKDARLKKRIRDGEFDCPYGPVQ